MRVRGEEGGKQMRGCFVFSGDIRRRHGCLMHPMVLFFWTVSASVKKNGRGGGRIGDGTGRMSSSNIIKKRNGRTVKAVTDSGEWRQVWEWGRTGGRRHALGKHMNQGGGGRQNVFLLLPLFACLRFWGRPTPREKALPPNSVSCLCWNTVTSQNQESKTDDVYV